MAIVTSTLLILMWLIVLCIFIPLSLMVLLISIVAGIQGFSYMERRITRYFESKSEFETKTSEIKEMTR